VPRFLASPVSRILFIVLSCNFADFATAYAADLSAPTTLRSSSGKLDVLMVARPQILPFSDKPAGYAYEICPRPKNPKARRCPIPGIDVDLETCPHEDDPAVSPYGGVRLHLNSGDTLEVRLVNCLPLAVNAKHVKDDASLKFNPTNLHTHGLIVEPHHPDRKDDPFGDYIFVIDLAPGVAPPTGQAVSPEHHENDHSANFIFEEVFVDYRIPIPKSHPSGLFWFHPHVHGLSLNQVAGGLAGIITIGASNQFCDPALEICTSNRPVVRDLILKDVQIATNAQVRFQENPAMCATPDANGQIGNCLGKGSTPGTTETGDDGRWEFTINGQSYPEIKVQPDGDVWRIANASASASYNLGLFPDGAPQPLVFQVLAIDGVSLVLPSGLTEAQASKLLGDKINVVPCPVDPQRVSSVGASGSAPPVCADSLRIMPSARAEIFAPRGATPAGATLRTVHRSTGLDGDNWPNIDLAKVTFPGPATDAKEHPQFLSVDPAAARAFEPQGIFSGPAMTRLAGSAVLTSVSSLQRNPVDAAFAARLRTLQPDVRVNCDPLLRGKAREILFGLPADPDKFGLGYRFNVPFDLSQQPSPPSPQENVEINEFNHADPPTVCVQLGADNSAVSESWILVNLAREDHNFHIHQTRFSLTSVWKDGNNVIPEKVAGAPVLLDNVPLPSGSDGCDGTVDAWISGACKPTFVTVSIPFHEVGDFVYHCHILEHEDGGMMAKITVVPPRH
jgi:L-ascorbate oxidase